MFLKIIMCLLFVLCHVCKQTIMNYSMNLSWSLHDNSNMIPWLFHDISMTITLLFHRYSIIIVTELLLHAYSMTIPWPFNNYSQIANYYSMVNCLFDCCFVLVGWLGKVSNSWNCCLLYLLGRNNFMKISWRWMTCINYSRLCRHQCHPQWLDELLGPTP